jgi:hypothetical protein
MALGWGTFNTIRRFGQGAQNPEVVRLAEHIERLEANVDKYLSTLPGTASHLLVPDSHTLRAADNPHTVAVNEAHVVDGVDGNVIVIVPESTAANVGGRIRFHLYNSPSGELIILEPNGTLLASGKTELEFPTSVELTSCFPHGWQCQAFLDVPADGSLYITTPVSTPLVYLAWTKVLGTTTSIHADNFTMVGSNRLRCDCPIPAEYKVTGTCSVTSPLNNKKYQFGIGLNGTILPESVITRKIAAGADEGAIPFQAIDHMSDTDYVEMFVRNITDSTAITYTTGNLAVTNAY